MRRALAIAAACFAASGASTQESPAPWPSGVAETVVTSTQDGLWADVRCMWALDRRGAELARASAGQGDEMLNARHHFAGHVFDDLRRGGATEADLENDLLSLIARVIGRYNRTENAEALLQADAAECLDMARDGRRAGSLR